MKAPPLPPHLEGVLWAYDEDRRALVCLVTRAGFTLPYLKAVGCTHEGLRACLPPLMPRLSAAPPGLRLRHGT
jgi:hypothetical protein